MSDDWSLEGKIKQQAHVEDWDDTLHIVRDFDYVKYSDIETLRKKLIEDMEDAWRKIAARDDKMKYMFLKAWRESISKRFGVKE